MEVEGRCGLVWYVLPTADEQSVMSMRLLPSS
jgi:hypothetical protein